MKNNFRFERKWVFKNIDKETLLLSLLNSKLFFIEQFNERVVNSIYFDDSSFSSVRDNLAGVPDRMKTRLRWYQNKNNLYLLTLENLSTFDSSMDRIDRHWIPICRSPRTGRSVHSC